MAWAAVHDVPLLRGDAQDGAAGAGHPEEASLKPGLWQHQIEDIQSLLERSAYGLWLQMGLGKTRIVIEAAVQLACQGTIDAVIIVCPAQVRSVWADPDPHLGEIARWLPAGFPHWIEEYSAKSKPETWSRRPGTAFIVTNPEFMRRLERLETLMTWAASRKTLLVGDEGWQWKTWSADQTKAMMRLRGVCQRVTLLNGTPGTMADLFSQFHILSPSILGVKNFWQARARWCQMGGYMQKKIVGFTNTEDFAARTAGYAIRRETRDCRDVVDPVRTQIEVPLTGPTWRVYGDMKRHLIAWLSTSEAAVSPHAGTKVMRLAQITSGLVGGVEINAQGDVLEVPAAFAADAVREISREKLDATIAYLRTHDPMPAKVILFLRFRRDVERTVTALAAAFPAHAVVPMYGGVVDSDRRRFKELFAPEGDPAPAIGVVNAQSGGAGLNLSAAWLCLFSGHEFSQRVRAQAEARIDRPGQKGRPMFVDILATGPKGERTLDHVILAAQRSAEETASWTAAIWRDRLTAADPPM